MDTSHSKQIAARLKVLGHPERLALIQLMQDAERFPDNLVDVHVVGVCVNDLARAAGMPQSTASTHLAALVRVGLLQITRHGQWRYARPDRSAFDETATHLVRLAGGPR